MIMKINFGLVILAVLFTSVKPNIAQDRLPNKQGCGLIESNRPPQFLTYDGKFESNIRLRLRNNSSCTVVVETDDEYPTQIKRLPQGGVRIEPVLDSQDGLRLPLHYFLEDRRRGRALRPAYGWGDSVFVYKILPGQSITFNVPVRHFRRRADVAVPFGYEWEGQNSIAATGPGGIAHLVYFLSEDVP